MKYIFALLFVLLFIGCGTTRYVDRTETIIKHDTIRVPVPEITDTLQAAYDSLLQYIHAEQINGKDTIIQIKYFPKEHKIYVSVKPDTIEIIKPDTTQINHSTTVYKEKSWFEVNAWYIIIGLTLLIILAAILRK